ncbi:hypothetical protein ACGF3C_02430 [Micromonospora sp. NPDC047762]|uniref:hypothetical protein n=1 Tax=Micromonospora sp. NPDC047762 TaxID=3364255 RepID=UPI00371847B7
MSINYDPSPVTAWPNTKPAHHPNAWTRWRDRLFGPDHTGADDTWQPANDLTAGVHHTDRIHKVDPLHGLTPAGFQYATGTEQQVHAGPDDATGIWEKPRKPIAALTATGHWAVYDEHLGGLNPGPLEPARIHDQLIGAEQ